MKFVNSKYEPLHFNAAEAMLRIHKKIEIALPSKLPRPTLL